MLSGPFGDTGGVLNCRGVRLESLESFGVAGASGVAGPVSLHHAWPFQPVARRSAPALFLSLFVPFHLREARNLGKNSYLRSIFQV